MNIKNVKHITTYQEGERKFLILKDEQGKFWAIEEQFVDEQGKLTQEINGITGLRSNSAQEAIERAHQRIVYQGLIAQGYSMEEALDKLFEEEL